MTPISIVVPTLNEEGHIGTCLGNLSDQLREQDEIIIVDGGSNDKTLEIAKRYESVRTFKPSREDSIGIGQARHIGTKKSSNPVVAQTDADAIPPSDWLDKIRLHFETDDDLAVLWGSIEDKNSVPIRNMVGRFWSVFGGTSGNNTAYRRSIYEELSTGYPKWEFAEDFGLIAKLAMKGKAKRDTDLVMRMDMDRKRYQTGPMIAWGVASLAAGSYVGGTHGDILKGVGLGLGGTEATYETVLKNTNVGDKRNTPHHDELGVSVSGLGSIISGPVGNVLSGVGAGIVGHHLLTEGVSYLPTELEKYSEVTRGITNNKR